MFEEIDNIDYRKYKGKFVVFHKRERAGRLFDLYDSKSSKYCFDFGQGAGGEITTDKLSDIDSLLVGIFTKRINEVDVPAKRQQTAKVA